MTEDASRDGLEWLEAHRGLPVTAAWHVARDAEYLGSLAEQRIEPAEVEEAEPMPVEVEPTAWREGAWMVIYTPSFTRILDQRAVAGARVEDEGERLVIEYGKRRFVLEERDDG
jgi:hypothetical protein